MAESLSYRFPKPNNNDKKQKKTNCFVFQHLKAVKDARIDLKKIVGDDIGFGYL